MISLAVLALNGAVDLHRRDEVRPDQFGTRICTAAKITSVTAIAGSVRRMRTPAVTPSANGERGVAERRDAAGAEHHRADPRAPNDAELPPTGSAHGRWG